MRKVMGPIKFIFILCTLLAAQVQCSAIIRPDDDDGGSGEIIVVNTAGLEIIEGAIDLVTEVAINAIKAFNSNIITIEKSLNDIEKALVDKLWDFVVNYLDNMDQDTSDAFLKYTIQCTKENGDDLKSTVYNFASQSVMCEMQKATVSLMFVPILTDIRNTNEKWIQLTKELKECGNDAAAEACIDEKNDAMMDELSKLGSSLEIEIAQVSDLIANANTFASECHEVTEKNMQLQLEKVSATLSECIQQGVLNNTST